MSIFRAIGGMFAGGSVTVNGRTVTCGQGQSITMQDGVFMIDGVAIGDEKFQKELEIAKKIDFVINVPDKVADRITLKIDRAHAVTVKGNVGSVHSGTGSVTAERGCNSISTTNGSVRVTGDVGGSVSTVNGSVHSGGSIGGSASSVNGSIHSQ